MARKRSIIIPRGPHVVPADVDLEGGCARLAQPRAEYRDLKVYTSTLEDAFWYAVVASARPSALIRNTVSAPSINLCRGGLSNSKFLQPLLNFHQL